MNTQLNVKDVEKLLYTQKGNNHYTEDVAEAMERRLRQLNSLLNECQKEQAHSLDLLNKAIDRENKARRAKEQAAKVEQATRGTKAHPAALAWYLKCKAEHIAALKHLADMRRRYAMAVKALGQASALLAKVQEEFRAAKARIEEIKERCNRNLQQAYDTLHRYFAATNPEIRESFKEYEEAKPEEKKAVTPKDLESRLNPGRMVLQGLLAKLYAYDEKFCNIVRARRKELEEGLLTREQVELKVRKQIVGRLAEEIVIHAFKPYAASIDTQAVTQVDDEHYTKTDVIARDLKVPVILGRGTGMAAREGGSIGIEVKAGQPEYLRAQKEHLLFQAVGHTGCNVSCIICTKDLKDLQEEQQFRQDIREGGSRFLAMLPYKQELDQVSIDFVLNKGVNTHV